MLLGRDVELTIGDDRGGVDGGIEFDAADLLLRFRGGEDDDLAGFISDQHLSVDHQSRSPDMAPRIERPVGLTGLGVDAVHAAAEIRDVN